MSAFRQEMKKHLFPKKKHKCFECQARITNTTRKRMATFRKVQGHVTAVGYQLCKPCAKLLQTERFSELPVISRDLAEADFSAGVMDCVGGVN